MLECSYGARFEIPGVSWQYFREPQRQLRIIRAAAAAVGKVKRSLGVWKIRLLRPDGDRGSPDVCYEYLVEAQIGWD